MADGKVTFFVDTNAFLQMRDLKDIAWGRIAPDAKAVDLMVAPRIISELDDHKVSTNDRRRTRARAALALIDEAAKAGDHALTIKQGPPVIIRVVLFPGGKFDWEAHPLLDQASTDDQLVAAAINFGNDAKVFSHDRGPRIRARLSKLDAPDPLEEWMLPEDKTDDQRKVTELQRDLARALSTKPNILAEFEGVDEETRELKLYIPVVKKLDFSQAEALSDAYFAAHPMKHLQRSPHGSIYDLRAGPTDSEIDDYEEKYRDFKTSMRQYFSKLDELVMAQGHAMSVPYYVKNDSGVAAEALRIEFELAGDGWLLGERDDVGNLYDRTQPPEVPETPRGMWDMVGSPLGMSPLIHHRERDPVHFYWKSRPGAGKTTSAMQCEDFRATREYHDQALVVLASTEPFSVTLHLQVSARNGTAPVNRTAKITVEKREVDWPDRVVLGLLPEEIGIALKQLLS